MEKFSHLPEELRRIIISQITDLTDILLLEQIAPEYNAYARKITHLTTSKFMIISLIRLFKYPHLQYIDHQIALKVSHISEAWLIISRIKQAHLVVNDLTIFELLIHALAKDGYYKISLLINETLYGIFITKNSAFGLYRDNRLGTYFNVIRPILIDSHFIINEPPYRTGSSPNTRKIISQSIRDLLKFTDFGLVDPQQPPSASNLSLNDYTKLLSDDATLTVILYNHLSDICRYYWGNRFLHYRNTIPSVDSWLSIQTIAQYEPISPLSDDRFTTIQRIITITFFKYVKMAPGEQIYKSDGSLGIRFK